MSNCQILLKKIFLCAPKQSRVVLQERFKMDSLHTVE